MFLTFDGAYDLQSNAQVVFDYRDLGGRTYSTVLVLTEERGDWRFYDVRFQKDSSVMSLGDAVYPQPGMEDVLRPS